MNGISVMGVLISYCAAGLYFIYKSRKTNAKLLFYMGLGGIFAGLLWLGALVDVLTILFTGNNMDNTYGLHGILSSMWIPLFAISLIYIPTKLLIPERRWYTISIYLILGFFFELFLFLDPFGSHTFVYPDSPGEDLIDSYITPSSPVGIIFIIYVLSIIIFFGFGCLYKSFKSTGILKKKFLLLSIGTIYVMVLGIFDALFHLGIIMILIRFGAVGGLIFFYLGLREEPVESKKVLSKKEVKIEESIFRFSRRPAQITEEEVTFHKEKKICLVCKGKVGGINVLIFMCKKCDVLYCENCARALINLENACWVCNTPIDESKPSKPFKKEEKEEVVIKDKNQN